MIILVDGFAQTLAASRSLVGVAYGSDPRKARAILLKLPRTIPMS